MIALNHVKVANFDLMDYAKPQYTVQKVNDAGRIIINPRRFDEISEALDVIDNWRASHSYPLQSFYVTLKRRACKIERHALTAQRTKRLGSIYWKLVHNKDTMKLSQMQDIAGCRAILHSIEHVRRLEQVYMEGDKRWRHLALTPKDYLINPKPSGYRGIHLKYRFGGIGHTQPYDGLKIEIQIRTLLQHTWATAVETAGIFSHQALKSNIGHKGWLRFFALISSVFALKERSPLVPGTPTTLDKLTKEIKSLDKDLKIARTFSGWRTITERQFETPTKKKAHFYLIKLDPDKLQVDINAYERHESQKANNDYTELEKSIPKGSSINAVLVGVSSITALKRAYPNYFLDSEKFLAEIFNITKSIQ